MERVWLQGLQDHFKACVRVVQLLQTFPLKITAGILSGCRQIQSDNQPECHDSFRARPWGKGILRVLRAWEGAAPCSAALLTVAGKDVSVSGCDASPAGAAQPHCLQLGGVRPAAGAGALEGLFEHRAEGDEGVRAGRVAAVSLAASQQHHLEHSMQKKQRQERTVIHKGLS